MYILAEFNIFSRSWKPISQFNTFNTAWEPCDIPKCKHRTFMIAFLTVILSKAKVTSDVLESVKSCSMKRKRVSSLTFGFRIAIFLYWDLRQAVKTRMRWYKTFVAGLEAPSTSCSLTGTENKAAIGVGRKIFWWGWSQKYLNHNRYN